MQKERETVKEEKERQGDLSALQIQLGPSLHLRTSKMSRDTSVLKALLSWGRLHWVSGNHQMTQTTTQNFRSMWCPPTHPHDNPQNCGHHHDCFYLKDILRPSGDCSLGDESVCNHCVAFLFLNLLHCAVYCPVWIDCLSVW